MKFTTGWYALYVKSRWEKKVHESLKELCFDSFLPQVKTIRKWSDRKKIIFKPLFPSYIFLNIRSSLEFHKALSVDGACTYIRFGKEYARIPEKDINQIRLLLGDKNIIDIETNVNRLKIGETKKIVHGPLSGLNCEIIEANNHNKIIVRIDSLRQNIVATVPIYSFESVI